MKLYQVIGCIIAVCYLTDISAMPCDKNREAAAVLNNAYDPESKGATSSSGEFMESLDGNKTDLIYRDLSSQKMSSGGLYKVSLGVIGGGPSQLPSEKKIKKRSVNRSRGKSIRRSKTKRMRGRALYGRLGISPEMTGVVFG